MRMSKEMGDSRVARKFRLGYRGSMVLLVSAITGIGFMGMVGGLSFLVRKELSSSNFSAAEIAGAAGHSRFVLHEDGYRQGGGSRIPSGVCHGQRRFRRCLVHIRA